MVTWDGVETLNGSGLMTSLQALDGAGWLLLDVSRLSWGEEDIQLPCG